MTRLEGSALNDRAVGAIVRERDALQIVFEVAILIV